MLAWQLMTHLLDKRLSQWDRCSPLISRHCGHVLAECNWIMGIPMKRSPGQESHCRRKKVAGSKTLISFALLIRWIVNKTSVFTLTTTEAPILFLFFIYLTLSIYFSASNEAKKNFWNHRGLKNKPFACIFQTFSEDPCCFTMNMKN